MLAQGRKHCILDLPVFQSPLFYSFKDELIQRMDTGESTLDHTLDRVLPHLRQLMVQQHSDLVSRINAQSEVAADQFTEINRYLNDQYVFMNTVCTKQNRMIQDLNHMFSSIGSIRLPEYDLGQEVNHLIDEAELLIHSASSPTIPERQSTSNAIADQQFPNGGRNVSNHVQYTLHKNHFTFQSVWDEWHGLNAFAPANNPSITFSGGILGLEQHYKGWRKSFESAEAKLFSRTKFLIGHVKAQDDIGIALNQLDQLF